MSQTKQQRDELIKEALGWIDRDECDTFNDPHEAMADFALSVLERESVYREICEAADAIYLDDRHLVSIWHDRDSKYSAKRADSGFKEFSTLIDAYQWVKEGGKDG